MNGKLDLVLAGGVIVQPGYGLQELDLGIRDGRIACLAERGALEGAGNVEDVSGTYLFPGVVDPHLHLTLGGGMEEYKTDTAAASIGGVTTVFNILIHPGAYLPEIARHRAAADPVVRTDYGLHLTLIDGDHIRELADIVAVAGVTSFKYFMSFRGDEGAYLGISGTTDGFFFELLGAVSQIDGVLAIHPENIEVVWYLRDQIMASGRDDLAAWDDSRPAFTEAEAIGRAAFLAERSRCTLYMVHLSSRAALEATRMARNAFPHLDIEAETCPHFLTHTRDAPIGSLGKVNPPLRSGPDIEALWEGLRDGAIGTVGSDHVGRRREMKSGSIWKASAGFPGTSTILPVLLDEGYHGGRLSLQRIAEVTASEPARIFGVGNRKGRLLPGFDADIAVVDLEWSRKPTASTLGTWCDYSLYEDRALKGWPRSTYLRGQLVQRDGEVVAPPGIGRFLSRGSGRTA